MYPQGILDIIHQVIVDNCPQLILSNCPKEILEKYPKDVLRSDPKRILSHDEFRLHFKEKLPNEFNLKKGKRFIADMPFDTFENLIISLEFQSSRMKFKHRSRFNVYQAVLHNEYEKYVFTVVFSMNNGKHKIIHHKINLYDEFTMLKISLKALNQKQSLNNISYKISNNIRLSDKEKALFLMLPAMENENRVENLKDTIRLLRLMGTIGVQEKRDMMSILFNFADEWFSEDDFEEIGGNGMVVELTESAQRRLDKMVIDKMKKEWEDEMEDKVKKEVEDKVKKEVEDKVKENEAKFAKKFLEDGFSVDDVLKYTSLKRSQVIALSNAIVLK